MDHARPYIIGIAGPSASGKSTLARALAQRAEGKALLFPVDAFYRDLGHLTVEARVRENFDHPDAIDWDLLHDTLDALCSGKETDAPVYDFTTHTRSAKTVRLAPAPLIILEGLLVLHDERLRERLDATIFVDCPRVVCLQRRITRDTTERGRTEDEVRLQFDEQVWPMAKRFVLPSRTHAQLQLNGEDAFETLVKKVATVIRDELAEVLRRP